MLDGPESAATSSSAVGETFESTVYRRRIEGLWFNIFDTAGLGEGNEGTVPTQVAIGNLYKLVRSLKGGINLLVLVFRTQFTPTTMKNYKLFFEVLCEGNVPLILVSTGLENEVDMDVWWEENRRLFHSTGMKFREGIGITAIKGAEEEEGWSLQTEYDISKKKLETTILDTFQTRSWRRDWFGWFRTALTGLLFESELRSSQRSELLTKAFTQYLGMTPHEARKAAEDI